MYHGSVVRGMNSMMVYGPEVQPAQQAAFLFCASSRRVRADGPVCHVWARQLKGHHGASLTCSHADRTEYEESHFFNALEKYLGDGFMDHNVEQHSSFVPALQSFATLIDDMRAGRKPFDGVEISRQVQAFGPALVEHLSEEIDTLDVDVLKAKVPRAEAQRIYKMQEDHIKSESGLVRACRRPILTAHRLPRFRWFSPVSIASNSRPGTSNATVCGLGPAAQRNTDTTDLPGLRCPVRSSGSRATSPGISTRRAGASALPTRTAPSNLGF